MVDAGGCEKYKVKAAKYVRHISLAFVFLNTDILSHQRPRQARSIAQVGNSIVFYVSSIAASLQYFYVRLILPCYSMLFAKSNHLC